MATARPLHFDVPTTRDIDAFTQRVLVYVGETFNWTISQSEASSVTVSPAPNTTWPLSNNSYTATPQTPAPATVNTNAVGQVASFQCNPAAPTSPQTLVVAIGVFGPCDQISVQQGQCFAWQNNSDKNLQLRGTGTWPALKTLHKNGGIVLIDTTVAPGTYPLSVTFEQGGSAACNSETEPKIIVTAPPRPK